MVDGQYGQWPEQKVRPSVDAGKLWTGGIATAVVAALVAVVGVLIIRGVFEVPIVAPGNTPGSIDYVGAVWLAAIAVCGGLLATGIAHVLLLVAPRPMTFFGWIVGLVTLAFVVWPFSVEVDLVVRITNAVLFLVIGAAIGTLLTSVAGSALRPAPRSEWPQTYG